MTSRYCAAGKLQHHAPWLTLDSSVDRFESSVGGRFLRMPSWTGTAIGAGLARHMRLLGAGRVDLRKQTMRQQFNAKMLRQLDYQRQGYRRKGQQQQSAQAEFAKQITEGRIGRAHLLPARRSAQITRIGLHHPGGVFPLERKFLAQSIQLRADSGLDPLFQRILTEMTVDSIAQEIVQAPGRAGMDWRRGDRLAVRQRGVFL